MLRLCAVYTSVTIIYNPNSTGDAPEKANDLAGQLQATLRGVPVLLRETERAGHAEELAFRAACNDRRPLVVSVSGDGGYHEVINGVMRAVEKGAEPVCAVLAAGNANDHSRLVHKRPLVDAITARDISTIDLLEASWDGKRRFAHSYIGLGLTPVVAVELNRHTLNALKELFLVVSTYWRYQPLQIETENKRLRLDSLVLANISGMAKVLKLSEGGTPTDGKFEVVMVPHRNKASMIAWALRSATVGPGKQPQTDEFIFKALEPMPMQLDGEVVELSSGVQVRVAIAHRRLKTVR